MIAVTKPIIGAGIALLLVTGLIHLISAPDSFAEAPYKGLLFVANAIGSGVAAVGIWRGLRSWGWGLGLVVTAGALVGYVLSRTVGLPGLEAEPDAWFEPLGAASLVVEGLFVGLGAYVLAKAAAGGPIRQASGTERASSRSAQDAKTD